MDFWVALPCKCPYCWKDLEILVGDIKAELGKSTELYSKSQIKWRNITAKIGSEKINYILDMVKKSEELPIREIIKKVKKKGIKERDVINIIDILKRSGDIYEPRKGVLGYI